MAAKLSKRDWYRLVYLRSIEWKRTRADYMRRVGWLCERCFVRRARIVHHLNYARLFNEQPEDLIALCCECHEMMHAFPKPANDDQRALPFKAA